MGNAKTQYKLKQANKKYKHDLKRRRKAFAEKKRIANGVEARGRKKNDKRRAELAYVNSIGVDIT